MSALPPTKVPKFDEQGLAEEAMALMALSSEAADGLAPQIWHLLGRHAYYALGAASSAVDALVHEANETMDREALDAVAGVLQQALSLAAHATGDPPA
jgi:hypothetical protein